MADVADAADAGETGLVAAWRACSPLERRQLLVLSMGGAAANLGFGVVIPALPSLSQELGFGATGVGLLLAAPGFARVLCNLPAGALVDRHGRVPFMVLGGMMSAMGCLGTAFGHSMASMLPMRFLGGAGGSFAAAASGAYLADMTEQKHLRKFRGVIVGAQGGLVAVAYVLGPALGGFLTDLYGAQTAYVIVAGIMGSCSAAFATLPNTMPPRAVAETGSTGQLFRQSAGEWRALLRDPNQRGLFAANLVLFLNYAALITVLPLQAYHVFGLSAGGVGALYSAGAIIGVLVNPLAGAFSDRHGRVPLVPPAALACALGCFGVAFLEQWEAFVASYMLWSVGESVLAPLLTAYAADIAPKEQVGSAMALSRQSGDLVFFLAPVGLGCLYDHSPGAAAMAGTALLTLFGGAFFRRHAREVIPRN